MKPASRRIAVTVLAAVAGLCVAVALAVLTSHLSTQRIGLAGESPVAGRKLVAPAHTRSPAKRRKRPDHSRTTVAPTPTPAAPTPAPAAAPPVVAPAPVIHVAPTVAPTPPVATTPTTTTISRGDDRPGAQRRGDDSPTHKPHGDD